MPGTFCGKEGTDMELTSYERKGLADKISVPISISENMV